MKEIEFLKEQIDSQKKLYVILMIALIAGIMGSFVQIVHSFGKGDMTVVSAYAKALFVVLVEYVLVRTLINKKISKFGAAFIWGGLLLATTISVSANIRYELTAIISQKILAANGIKAGIVAYVPTVQFGSSSIAEHVDFVNWMEVILFSGSIPVLVLGIAVASKVVAQNVADITAEYGSKFEEYKKERRKQLKVGAAQKGLTLEDYVTYLQNKKQKQQAQLDLAAIV